MTTITATTARETIPTLIEGTMLMIPGKKQAVRVTEVMDHNGSLYVYTTSGYVRPGAFKGGKLWFCRHTERLIWQATAQQQAVVVSSVQVAGLAN